MTIIKFALDKFVKPGTPLKDFDGDTIGAVTEVEVTGEGELYTYTADIDGALSAGDVVDALRLDGAHSIDLAPRS